MSHSPTMAGSAAKDRSETLGWSWYRSYRNRLVISDVVVIAIAVFCTQLVLFGQEEVQVYINGRLSLLAINYTAVSVVLCASWVAVLAIFGTRGRRVIGSGSSEFRLILEASLLLFGLAALISYLLMFDLSRGYFLLAFPVGVALLLAERYLWRRWLWAKRSNGKYSSNVLIVGSETSCRRIADELSRQAEAGYHVAGVSVPATSSRSHLVGTTIPIFGDFDQIELALDLSGADTVLIASSDELSPERVREISWKLDANRQHLIVAPGLADVAGPRIHTRPVAGLPLIHVEMPKFEGHQRTMKRAFDIAGAGLLLAILSPFFLATALLIKVSSPGPIFYRQERIGIAGKPFGMLKFRSMVDGADASLLDLLEEQGNADRPLFKVKDDPRITPLGRVLRKYSIDEFPQLVNVLVGDMSLVGPRPQREGEVALYDDVARRRLIVQPGMSGLWQVSGRSLLSWEESIRLDLYYVENWSMTGDISILLRTMKAVVAPGATAH